MYAHLNIGVTQADQLSGALYAHLNVDAMLDRQKWGGARAPDSGYIASVSMTPPVVADSAHSSGLADSSGLTVNIPAHDAGDRLIVAAAIDGGHQGQLALADLGSDSWTKLADLVTGGGSTTNATIGLFEIVATSTSSGATTAALTWTGNEKSEAHCLRVVGSSSRPAEWATAANYGGQPVSFPMLYPSWGSDDTMWLAVCGNDDGRDVPSGPPQGYTLVGGSGASGSGGTSLHVYRRGLRVHHETPGGVTLSGPTQWRTLTVGIV